MSKSSAFSINSPLNGALILKPNFLSSAAIPATLLLFIVTVIFLLLKYIHQNNHTNQVFAPMF